MKKLLFVAIFLQALALNAQQTDSTLVARAHFNSFKQSPAFDYRMADAHYLSAQKVSFPVVMILYGFIGLGNHELQNVNREIKDEIRENNDHFKIGIDNYLQFGPAASVYALNAVGVKGRNNFKDRSIILGMSTALMAGTVFALKRLTHQERPDGSAFNSFPSGHTAMAFTGAEFMQQEYRDYSPFLRYSGYAMAAGTGTLRMYNNRHWLTDVITGAGIGILSTKASYWIWEKAKQRKQGKSFIL
jgi:hypothetical protein